MCHSVGRGELAQPLPGCGVKASCTAGVLVELERLDERTNDLRIELGSGATAELGDRVFSRACLPVGALRRHRLEGVADGDDSCFERYVVAGKAVGVASAVPPLMRGAHDPRASGQRGAAARIRSPMIVC